MVKSDNTIRQIRQKMADAERYCLSEYGAKSEHAQRRRPDARLDNSYRLAYAADVDRILNSLAYTRYIDKTQVFSIIHNDHITHRVLHVQLVSRVARTIGRALGLNEDLIEAISLAHDIGHPPFGHDGEAYLSALTQAHGLGPFHHNIQSIRCLEHIENRGRGLNLTLQTLDGVICHNGEAHNKFLRPVAGKTFSNIDALCENPDKPSDAYIPMTLEGCVVRLADTISYLGRDIEDAVRLGIIHRNAIPFQVKEMLGNTNGTIVYTLVTDIIQSSLGKGQIEYSDEVSDRVEALRHFNYRHIYTNTKIKKHLTQIKEIYWLLFERFCSDIDTGNEASAIYQDFLGTMDERYISQSTTGEMARDFIAGMTDNYFLRQAPPRLRPEPVTL